MLTKSEKQIMNLLWGVNRPLTCAEIVEMSGDRTWKDSYVHSLIKSLMKKDVVQVEAFELVSRSYARKFSPKVTKEEFFLREYFAENRQNSMSALIKAFLKRYATDETVSGIEKQIKDWKRSRKA